MLTVVIYLVGLGLPALLVLWLRAHAAEAIAWCRHLQRFAMRVDWYAARAEAGEAGDAFPEHVQEIPAFCRQVWEETR